MIPDFVLSFLLFNTKFLDSLNLYEAQQKLDQFQDAVINSPIYGIIFYLASIILAFICGVIVIFMLIMLLKRK